MKNAKKILLVFLAIGDQFLTLNAAQLGQNVSDHLVQMKQIIKANELEWEATLLLGKAISDFDVETIKFALEKGADLNAKFYETYERDVRLRYSLGKKGYSVLTWAIKKLPFNKILNSERQLKDINYSFNLSETCKGNKYLDTLNFIIEKVGVNGISYLREDEFNEFGRIKAYNALMYAFKRNDFEVTKFLISKGADVNFVSKTGDSAFTYLIDEIVSYTGEECDISLCNYLVEQLNDLNQIINQRELNGLCDTTPLFYITKKYSSNLFIMLDSDKLKIKKIIEALIRNGADIYFKDLNGNLLIEDPRICDAELKDFIIKTYELHKDEIEALKKAKEKRILESIPKILPEMLAKLIVSYLGFNKHKDGEATAKASEPLINQA